MMGGDGICRPREKIHRPQTRRRRENNEDSLDKMQAIRKNMKKACEILEWLMRREQRKVNLAVRNCSLHDILERSLDAPPC